MVSACHRDTGINQKSSQWPKLEQFEQENKKKMILDHNPKYKTNVHEMYKWGRGDKHPPQNFNEHIMEWRGKKSNFTVEKQDKHHLGQAIEVNIGSNTSCS
jgi:hypothetical protein